MTFFFNFNWKKQMIIVIYSILMLETSLFVTSLIKCSEGVLIYLFTYLFYYYWEHLKKVDCLFGLAYAKWSMVNLFFKTPGNHES